MGKLMTSPFTIKGELHDVHLFNFSVDPDELQAFIPAPFRLALHNDRAWISVVSVCLKNMRPSFFPLPIGLQYHHIAYRVLVDCPVQDENGETEFERGIYFLESFTSDPLIFASGNLISEYKFLKAKINYQKGTETTLTCQSDDGQHLIQAFFDNTGLNDQAHVESVKALIAPLTQAFSVDGKQVTKVQIVRERWPLIAVNCTKFQCSFFKSARFEAAFKVDDVIYYTWQKAKKVPALW